MNNLQGGSIDLSDLKFCTSPEAEDLLLQVNDVLFNRTNSIEHVGRTSLWRGELPKASFASYLVRLIPDPDKLDPEYLVRWLNLPQIQIAIRQFATPGVHQVNINPTNLQKTQIRFPQDVREQRKIAKILTTIDNLIEKTEALIAKYQAIKQGMMHDLFTRDVDEHGHLRPPYTEAPELYKQSELGWIPREWGVDCIDNVLDRIIDYRGKTPTKTDNGVQLITAKNVRMGFVDVEPKEYISEHAYENWMTRGIPQEGDVLFTTEAPLANVAQIATDQRFAFAQRVIILRTNERLLNTFLKYLLMTEQIRRRIFAKGTDSTVEGIKQSQFRLLLVAFPSGLREQQGIVDKLVSIERQASTEQVALRKYQLVRTGLMQDLLTGKVRVKVDEAQEAAV